MKNKRGQFYFLAIMVLIIIFVSFATVFNSLRVDKGDQINEIKEELKLERKATLDYLSINDIDESSSKSILINFSKTFTNKIGLDKDIFFIVGNKDSITIIGNHLPTTNTSIKTNTNFANITQIGEIETIYSPTINPIYLQLETNNYSFYLEDGQNIYYLISHKDNKEVNIIQG